jgi:hypothetical protein
MRPVKRTIATDPEVIPLNHYGEVGAGIYVSGAATVSALADSTDITSIIAAVSNGVLAYPADALLIVGGIGQTVIVSQYGN